MSIHVSAIIKSKVGYAADLKPFLLDLVNESRNERACLQFELYQSLDNENIFFINEIWLEEWWFDIYCQQEYVDNFKNVSEALVEQSIIIHRMEKIA